MDENDKFKDFNRRLESIEKSSIKSKDYIKFVIGLSTGTLVFSVTFAKEFIKTPHYQFILIIGWTCLFVSIILGVWILPIGDRIQSLFGSLKSLLIEPPEKFVSLTEKKLQEYYLREFIKTFFGPDRWNDERNKDFFGHVKTASAKDLKTILKNMSEMKFKEPEEHSFLKDVVGEIFNFMPLIIKFEEKFTYPPTVLKTLRRAIWQGFYLEKGMRYSFFVGMFAILIFSIINLLR